MRLERDSPPSIRDKTGKNQLIITLLWDRIVPIRSGQERITRRSEERRECKYSSHQFIFFSSVADSFLRNSITFPHDSLFRSRSDKRRLSGLFDPVTIIKV